MDSLLKLEIFLLIVCAVAIAVWIFAKTIMGQAVFLFAAASLAVISIMQGDSLFSAIWSFNVGLHLMSIIHKVEKTS